MRISGRQPPDPLEPESGILIKSRAATACFHLALAFSTPLISHAAEVTKADNIDSLASGSSWVGGNAPSGAEVALFDATYAQAAASTLGTGAALSWGGIKVTAFTSGTNLININNTTTTNHVGIGADGIDMSAAERNLRIYSAQIQADQAWSIAAGRMLEIGPDLNAPLAGGYQVGLSGSKALRLIGGGSLSLATDAASSIGVLENHAAAVAEGNRWTLVAAPDTTYDSDSPGFAVQSPTGDFISQGDGTHVMIDLDGNTWTFDQATGLLTVVPADPLVWNNASGDGLWNTSSANWDNGTTDVAFTDGDKVRFGDLPGAFENVTIPGTVAPQLLTLDTFATDHTFSGSGRIDASGPIIALGGGFTTFSNTGGITTTGTLTVADKSWVALETQATPSSTTIGASSLLEFLAGGSLTGPVANAGELLDSSNSGTLTLSGANSYTGTTTVSGGTLAIDGDALPDAASLVIDGGVVEPTGTEVVATLFFGTAQQAAGTWGATGSGAANIDDTRFAGIAGVISVTTGPGLDYATWSAANANGDGPDLDSDGDGVPNGVEFLMGETGSSFTPTPALVNGTITWPKDPTALASWAIEISTNLQDEVVPGDGGWTTTTTGVTDNGGSITFTPGTTEEKLFIRLRVTVAP